MARAFGDDTIVGILLVVLGILVLAGWFGSLVVFVAAVALVVMGILMLVGKLAGGTVPGIVLLVLGILLLFNKLPLLDDAIKFILIAVGIVLVVFGVLKLMHKA